MFSCFFVLFYIFIGTITDDHLNAFKKSFWYAKIIKWNKKIMFSLFKPIVYNVLKIKTTTTTTTPH